MTRRREITPRRAAMTLVIATATALMVGLSAPAEPRQTRVVDRTFSCSVPAWAGARPLIVSAVSGFRDSNERRWRWLSSAAIYTRDGYLASISAGAPPPVGPTGTPSPRWLSIVLRHCSPTSVTVPWSRVGLVGGVASQLPGARYRGSDSYDCRVAGRVLVRLRAEFVSPVTLRAVRRFDERVLTTTTATPTRRAQLAIRTPAGRPLTYATVAATGKATLFTPPSCPGAE